MTSNPAVVYRTRDPEIVAKFEANEAAEQAWTQAAAGLAERLSGRRRFDYFFDPMSREVHLERIPDAGDVTTADWPEPLRLELPGMPPCCPTPSGVSTYYVQPKEDHLDVIWEHELPDGNQPDERWHEVPLSQWHAERAAVPSE